MKKFRKFIALLLAVLLMFSSNTIKVFAKVEDTFSLSENGQINLQEIWENDKKIIESINFENDYLVTRFTLDNDIYEIIEDINSDMDYVESRFYKVVNNKKIFIGNIYTELIKSDENIEVRISENGKILFSDIYNIRNFPNESSKEDNILSENSSLSCEIEEKWFFNGTHNGSNKFQQLTVGAVVVMLATAAGFSGIPPKAIVAGSGLLFVAEEIVREKWERVYWTQSIWTLNKRSTCSPIYPNWYSGGKYRYKTKYYSDPNRTKFLGETNYCDC